MYWLPLKYAKVAQLFFDDIKAIFDPWACDGMKEKDN